jgi:hypothetical protein
MIFRTIVLTSLVTLVSSNAFAQTKPQATGKAPSSASPAAATPLERERSLHMALEKQDYAGFNEVVGADFVYVDQHGTIRWERAKTADILKGCKATGLNLADFKSSPVGADVLVATYTLKGEWTCDGTKFPMPIYSMSVWRRQGPRWVVIAHTESPAAPAKK